MSNEQQEAQENIEAILEEGKEVSLTIVIKDKFKARCILRSLFWNHNNDFGFHVTSLGLINEIKFFKDKLERVREAQEAFESELDKILKS